MGAGAITWVSLKTAAAIPSKDNPHLRVRLQYRIFAYANSVRRSGKIRITRLPFSSCRKNEKKKRNQIIIQPINIFSPLQVE
jgi:hypothetical protein